MSTASSLPPTGLAGPGVALSVAVGDLRVAAGRVRDALSSAAFTALPDAAAATVATDLAAVAETAQAGAWAALARVADSGFPQSQGYVTAGSWWKARTRVSKDEAAQQVRLARRLARHYAATSTAWADGAISGDHARVIAGGVDAVLARLARRIRREHAAGEPVDAAALAETISEARAGLEAELLGLARRWGPETLRVALTHARNVADPDGASEAAMAAATQAAFRIDDVGDMAVVTAHVSCELAAKLRVIIDHHRSARYRTGQPAAGGTADPSEDGGRTGAATELDAVTGDPVVVTNAQRDAAAFEDWIASTLDSGLGTGNVSERPHLDVLVTLADLAAGTGTAVLERTGDTVPVQAAARIACDADVRVVLVDGQYRDPQSGEPVEPAVAALHIAGAGILDYGRAHRIVPSRLRRALALRDRGCAFPGCHRPPAHTQAHHVLPWEHGGDTSLANTVLLCSRHHHYVHEGGWIIAATSERSYHEPGCWQFRPPERRPHGPPPASAASQ